MSTSTFFSTDNRHNERLIRILSVGSLVSKPPTKEKRISIKVRMPLSTGGIGTGIMGAPEWLEQAYLFVAKNGSSVNDENEFKSYALEFSSENLFGEPILTNDSIMRGFEISEFGNEETPDVMCSFTIRIPFSGKRWEWLGMCVGEDVWVKFTPGDAGTVRVEDEQDGTLLDDGENDEDEEGDEPELESAAGDDPELDKPEELEYDSGPKLVHSGPKELAAYHEKVVEGEVKRGRGRPRKIPSGFENPLHQGNEF